MLSGPPPYTGHSTGGSAVRGRDEDWAASVTTAAKRTACWSRMAFGSVEYELRPLLGRGAQAPPGARRLRSPGHGSAYALTGSAPAPAPSARRPSGTG